MVKVIIPERSLESLSFLYIRAVNPPEKAEERAAKKVARDGGKPFKMRCVNTQAPSGNEPSIVRSGKSNIRNAIPNPRIPIPTTKPCMSA
jgi:hypothetical protein